MECSASGETPNTSSPRLRRLRPAHGVCSRGPTVARSRRRRRDRHAVHRRGAQDPRRRAASRDKPWASSRRWGRCTRSRFTDPRARFETGFVVVSIFVNPTQFNASDDLDAYPGLSRPDPRGVRSGDADLVFQKDADEMYRPRLRPKSARHAGLTEPMEGAHRPGHFDGVALVCTKLFSIGASARPTSVRRTRRTTGRAANGVRSEPARRDRRVPDRPVTKDGLALRAARALSPTSASGLRTPRALRVDALRRLQTAAQWASNSSLSTERRLIVAGNRRGSTTSRVVVAEASGRRPYDRSVTDLRRVFELERHVCRQTCSLRGRDDAHDAEVQDPPRHGHRGAVDTSARSRSTAT